MKHPGNVEEEEVEEEVVESTPTAQKEKEKEKKVVKKVVAKPAGLNWYGVGVTILFVLPLVVTGFIYVSSRHLYYYYLRTYLFEIMKS